MTKQNSSSVDQRKYLISGKVNLFFIILFIFPMVPITIGYMGIFDQYNQPIILNTAITVDSNAEYTINLDANSIYYITITPSDTGISGDFSGVLSFFKDSDEVYHDTIQKPTSSVRKGIHFAFKPFTPDTEGSYIINCTINYADTTYPFYIKMQKAAEVAHITGFSGEEILGVGMIMFLAIVVLLIIVALIARGRNTVKLGKLASKPEDTQSKFEWKSNNGNEDS